MVRRTRNEDAGRLNIRWGLALAVLLGLALAGPAPAPARSSGGHCGAEGDWRSTLVPDVWPPENLRRSGLLGRAGRYIKKVAVYKACIAHDKCYDTPGAARANCDRRFEADMRAECERVYRDPLDLPLREACCGAAHTYYLAVVKNGQESFDKAQQRAKHRTRAATKRGPDPRPAKPATRTAAVESASAGPAHSPEAAQTLGQSGAPKLAWDKLGTVKDAGGMAAMSGRIFLYRLGSDKLMVSRQHKLEWAPLGPLPPHRSRGVFTAGVGRLYFWDADTGQLHTTTPGPIRWRCLGRVPGIAGLAVGGNKIYALTTGGEVWASRAHKLEFAPLGKAEGAAAIAAEGKTLYALDRAGEAIRQAPAEAGLKWRTVGKAQGPGMISVRGLRVFMLNAEGGLWSARLPR